MDTIFIGNDNVVKVEGVKFGGGAVVKNAVVECTIYEYDRVTELDGVTWPKALTENDPGDYEVKIPAAAELINGNRYYLRITAVKNATHYESWCSLIAQYRSDC